MEGLDEEEGFRISPTVVHTRSLQIRLMHLSGFILKAGGVSGLLPGRRAVGWRKDPEVENGASLKHLERFRQVRACTMAKGWVGVSPGYREACPASPRASSDFITSLD